MFLGSAWIKGGCDLSRGTRGKAHSQPAFKVAHLAAGGTFLPRALTIDGMLFS